MRRRVPYLLLVIAGLFAYGFVSNMITGEAEPGDTAAQLAIIGIALAAFWFVRREERLRNELLTFLRANIDAVRAGTAVHRGHTFSYATRLRTNQIVLSFFILSFRLPSRLIVDGAESDRGVRSGCSLITFLFGWWGIPWGPIWTLRALSSNMRGANVQSVGEVLEGKSDLVVPVAQTRR